MDAYFYVKCYLFFVLMLHKQKLMSSEGEYGKNMFVHGEFSLLYTLQNRLT